MRKTIGIFCLLFTLIVTSTCAYKSVKLKQECTGHLKRAADANSTETAKVELNAATNYLEQNNLTKGYTSVFYNTPDEDIEFFYNNLKASEEELAKIDSTTTSLEKTNVLMKLRETLMDNNKDGDHVTTPMGLSRYPHNLAFSLLGVVSILTLLMGAVLLAIEY